MVTKKDATSGLSTVNKTNTMVALRTGLVDQQEMYDSAKRFCRIILKRSHHSTTRKDKNMKGTYLENPLDTTELLRNAIGFV